MSRLRSPRSPCSLIGRSLRRPHHFEGRHSRDSVVEPLLNSTTVNHVFDAWNGQRCFCYVGGDHTKTSTRWRRPEHLRASHTLKKQLQQTRIYNHLLSHLRLLIRGQQGVEREDIQRDGGVTFIFYRDTNVVKRQNDSENEHFFRLAHLYRRDHLRGRGPSRRPRCPPPCPRLPHPEAEPSSYPSRFGEET